MLFFLVHLKYVLPTVNYLHSTCHMRLCYWRPGKGLMKRQNASCVVPRAQKEREIYQLTKGNSPGTKKPLGNRPQIGQQNLRSSVLQDSEEQNSCQVYLVCRKPRLGGEDSHHGGTYAREVQGFYETLRIIWEAENSHLNLLNRKVFLLPA